MTYIYVDGVFGHNSNNGQTFATPFKSLEKGINTLSDGDTLYIKQSPTSYQVSTDVLAKSLKNKSVTISGEYLNGPIYLKSNRYFWEFCQTNLENAFKPLDKIDKSIPDDVNNALIPESWKLNNKNKIEFHYKSFIRDKYYKFTENKYVEKFFSKGEIYINTLHNFRDEEKHDAHVGDNHEGRFFKTGKLYLIRGNMLPACVFSTLDLSNPDDLKDVIFDNIGFEGYEGVPNQFIYCFSKECNDNLLNKFGDSYFVINEPEKFFRVIAQYFYEKDMICNVVRLNDVNYTEKVYIDYLPDIDQIKWSLKMEEEMQKIISERYIRDFKNLKKDESWFFIKREKYDWQKEARFVMHPVSGSIEGKVITVPEARKFCSLPE